MNPVVKASLFVTAFYLLVCTTLYPPFYVAPDITTAFQNQPDFDPVQTGAYRKILLSTSGIFTFILYTCLMDHIYSTVKTN